MAAIQNASRPNPRSPPKVERRVEAQLLALTDGFESRGRVNGVTNLPDLLDPALRRQGCLSDRDGHPLDRKGRSGILRIHT